MTKHLKLIIKLSFIHSLLHAKNQLSSSKKGHFRTNFIFRQNLDFSMGVSATVQRCLYWDAIGLIEPIDFDDKLI